MYLTYLKFIFALAVCFGLSSCCTKKKCNQALATLTIKATNFKPDDNLVIIYQDRISHASVRQQTLTAEHPSFTLSSMVTPDGQELKAYDYILESNFGTTDTISDIDYTKNIVRKSCNTCPSRSGDYYDDATFSNFTYLYKGQKHHDNNQIIITRP